MSVVKDQVGEVQQMLRERLQVLWQMLWVLEDGALML
jgi:hypothetical protein